jgi:hypothetical protein
MMFHAGIRRKGRVVLVTATGPLMHQGARSLAPLSVLFPLWLKS